MEPPTTATLGNRDLSITSLEDFLGAGILCNHFEVEDFGFQDTSGDFSVPTPAAERWIVN
jgi:hypothetical protein